MRALLAVTTTICCAVAALAYGQSSRQVPQTQGGRFVLIAEQAGGQNQGWGGVWRMDTATGELWRCSISTNGIGCYPSPNAK